MVTAASPTPKFSTCFRALVMKIFFNMPFPTLFAPNTGSRFHLSTEDNTLRGHVRSRPDKILLKDSARSSGYIFLQFKLPSSPLSQTWNTILLSGKSEGSPKISHFPTDKSPEDDPLHTDITINLQGNPWRMF